jgi:hypothetical protein
MWSDDWTVLAVGSVISGDEVIWYCISIYETDDATMPLAA